MNDNIDFKVPAELYPAASRARGPLAYQRFQTLAEAVKYAVEELRPLQLKGALIEADEIRHDGAGIVALYHSPSFPLPRRELQH